MIGNEISPFLEAFGWTFIHSLWQGLLVFGILKIFLSSAKKQTAGFRYLLILTAMIAMSTWSILTFINHIPTETVVSGELGSVASATPITDPDIATYSTFSLQDPAGWGNLITALLPLFAPWTFIVWLIGVTIMGLRLVGNFLYLNQLRRLKSFPAGPDLQQMVQNLLSKTNIRRKVHLRLSNRILEPITFGFLKPVILLPASMISQIPPDQLEALILHEIAHIHRYDYLVNLIQIVIEICFFYHPVIWWFSRQLREERELSCDEWVLEYGAEKNEYAQALIFLEKQKFSFQNQLAMSAKGNKSSLTQRIFRLYESNASSPSFTRGIFAIIFLIILFTGITMGPKIFFGNSETTSFLVEGIPVPSPPAAPAAPEVLPPPPPPPVVVNGMAIDHDFIYKNAKLVPDGNSIKVVPEFGLYVVNGVVGGKELLKQVTRTNVKAFSSLAPPEAIKIYGKKGRRGAMIIEIYDAKPLMEGFYFGGLTRKDIVEFGFHLNWAEEVKINIINEKKEIVQEFLHETLQEGEHNFDWKISDLPYGKYHLILLAGGLQHSFKIEKNTPPPPPPPPIEGELHFADENSQKASKEVLPGLSNLATELIAGDQEKDFKINLSFEVDEPQMVRIFVLDKATNMIETSIEAKVLTKGQYDYSWSAGKNPDKHYVGMIKTAKGETKLFDLNLQK